MENRYAENGVDNKNFDNEGAIELEAYQASSEIDEKKNGANDLQVKIFDHDGKSSEKRFEDLPYDPNTANFLPKLIEGARSNIFKLASKNPFFGRTSLIAGVISLTIAYFIGAIAYNLNNDLDWDWCDGHGLLTILFFGTYLGLLYYHVLKPLLGKRIHQFLIGPCNFLTAISSKWHLDSIFLLTIIIGIYSFVIIDSWNTPRRMVSAGGVIVFVLIGLFCSKSPERVQWRTVLAGLITQFVFALLVLRWKGGRDFLECVSLKVTRFFSFADEGSSFIFGYLASGKIDIGDSTVESLIGQSIVINTVFAFQGLCVIYLFSFIIGLLYHLGIMTWVVMKVGWLLQILLGTTAVESMNASANIFLGMAEAPILIKPFLHDLTMSEIHAVMTGGFATIAGSVMAAYISFGVNSSSLLTASVMAAPTSLACSKLVCPETQVSKTCAKDIEAVDTKCEGNAIDAASQGAAQGFFLIGNIIANIIAVVSFISFLNAVISWLGFLIGQDQLSFEWILGKVFIPFAYCLGVDDEDVENVSLLLGLKLVVNEFVAYQKMLKMTLSPRSRTIAEYALCSFANLGGVGIQIGTLATLGPERRMDYSKLVWSALFAATLTSFLNGCVAGALISI